MAYKRIAVFALGIALVLFVLSLFGIQETFSALLRTRPDIFFACIILQLASTALIIVRIKILAWHQGYLSWPYAARLTLSGVFVSMITPFAKLGGEPLKMYMLGKNIGSYNASAAVAVESLVELVSSFAVIVVVTAFFFALIPGEFLSLLIAVLVILCVGIVLFAKLLYSPKWVHKLGSFVLKKLERFHIVESKEHLALFNSSMASMWKRRYVFIGAFFVSVLSKIVEIARFWLIFLALGIVLPFNIAVVVWTIILVIMFIPWLPGSLGLVEFGGISVLILFGVAQPIAASGMILDRLLSLWLVLAVGILALSWSRKRGELPKLSSMINRTDKKKS